MELEIQTSEAEPLLKVFPVEIARPKHAGRIGPEEGEEGGRVQQGRASGS